MAPVDPSVENPGEDIVQEPQFVLASSWKYLRGVIQGPVSQSMDPWIHDSEKLILVYSYDPLTTTVCLAGPWS